FVGILHLRSQRLPVLNQFVTVSLRKNVLAEKPVYCFWWRQRKNVLITLQAIFSTQRPDAALQHFISRQAVDGEANQRPQTTWQSPPPIPVMNTQVWFVTAKELVWALTDEGNFDILACALRDKIHRNNRRSCDWFFQAFYDPRQRLLEVALVEPHGYVLGPKKRGCLRCVNQLIIAVCLSVSYGVGGP